MGDAELPRIFVDFNTTLSDPRRRAYINTHFQPELLQWLRPGLTVVLYEPNDIAVRATVEHDEDRDAWYGVPDWSTLEHL